MAYISTNWVDHSPPGMSAANLNKIEQGIAEAHEAIRAILDSGQSGTTSHAALTGRDSADSHPIGAITGLQGVLNSKADDTHTHSAADITDGVLGPARLGTGEASPSTFLRGDGTWATPEGDGEVITSHADLDDRDAEDQHPISAITGLRETLEGKADSSHNHEGQFQPTILVFSDEVAVLAALSSGQVRVGDIVAVED